MGMLLNCLHTFWRNLLRQKVIAIINILGLANLVAWPLSLWAMTHWLQRFPYRIDNGLLFTLCIAATLLALCVAGLTVGSTAFRAANRLPASALGHG